MDPTAIPAEASRTIVIPSIGAAGTAVAEVKCCRAIMKNSALSARVDSGISLCFDQDFNSIPEQRTIAFGLKARNWEHPTASHYLQGCGHINETNG